MSEGRRKERKARDGEVFHKVSLGGGVGIHTFGERREIIEGPISARIVWSEKFGWELHFNIYTKKGGERIEIRNPSEWDRLEIYIQLNEETIDRIIEMEREKIGALEKLRRKLKA